MIKYSITTMLPLLHKLFNHILESEIFPAKWSEGFIQPLHKSGDNEDPTNYRGITISNCLGKLYTSILNRRLLQFCDEKKIINKFQIGFLPKNRTADHILVLKTLIDTFKRRRKPLLLCFIDFKKAFDTVSHKGLYHKLRNMNISSKFINTVKSMYSQLIARVKINPTLLTDKFEIEVGTRQGCNLSPTLFNIFINDIPDTLYNDGENKGVTLNHTNLNCLMYADDLVILSHSAKEMKRKLHILEEYCNKWRLIINTNKSKLLIINNTKTTPDFEIYGNKLEIVDSYKYLGITVHKSGSLKPAAEELHRKASRAYYSLRQNFNFNNNTKPEVILKLFDSLIKPILLYCSEIWSVYSWSKNSSCNIMKFITGIKQSFESLHDKMSRHALGVHRQATAILTKAELGRYPLSFNIIKNINSYAKHINDSKSSSLLYETKLHLLGEESGGHSNFLTRTKCLFDCLGLHDPFSAHISPQGPLKITKQFTKIYHDFFFQLIRSKVSDRKSGGRFETYEKIKKNYYFEPYLRIKDQRRRNITNIRISTHNLPIEKLRKYNVPRENRLCLLCNSGELGTEEHTLLSCQNSKLITLRNTLNTKIATYHSQWHNIPPKQQLLYLISATDPITNYYFSIFLGKVFTLVNDQSTKSPLKTQ